MTRPQPRQVRVLDSALKALVELGLAGRWTLGHPETAAKLLKAVLLDRVLVEPYPRIRGEERPEALMRSRLRTLRGLADITQGALTAKANETLEVCSAKALSGWALTRFERKGGTYNLKFLEAMALCQALDVPMLALSPWRLVSVFESPSTQELRELRSGYAIAVDPSNQRLAKLRQEVLSSRGHHSRPQADLVLGKCIQQLRKDAGYSRSELLHLVNVQMVQIGAPIVSNGSLNSPGMVQWGYEVESARRCPLSLIQGYAIAQTLSLEPEQLCPYLVSLSGDHRQNSPDSALKRKTPGLSGALSEQSRG